MHSLQPIRRPIARRRWPAAGAFAFPCTPEKEPAAEPALWLAAVSPATVILDAAPPGCTGITPRKIAEWPIIVADRLLSDGRHLVLSDVDGFHHLWIRDTLLRQPLAYVIVRDAAAETRRQAASRLDRRLAGAPPSRHIGASRPTGYQRRRLNRLLDILDIMGTADGPLTSYDIAQRLIYPDLKIGRGIDWKSSSERRHAMRLIGQARRLANGGYRDLLRGIVRG